MGLDGEMLSGAHFISSPPSNGCYGRKYVNLCWCCAALGVTNAIPRCRSPCSFSHTSRILSL